MKKINTKYNKYNIGDTVGYKENLLIDFEVMNVLPNEPEKEGEYWYVCKLINDRRKPVSKGRATEEAAQDINNQFSLSVGRKYNCKEDKLFLIKKATSS